MAGKWNKEKVVEAIRARKRLGLSFARMTKDDSALYQAGKAQFGNWYDALIAAGVQPAKQKWSKQRVIEKIRERHAAGLRLRKTCQEDRPLFSAARWYFGSWHSALSAADVPIEVNWTRTTVMEAIRARHKQGLSMCRAWREDRSLYGAAARIFGTWKDAISACGIEPFTRLNWTKQRVIEAIRTRQRQGLPLRGLTQLDPNFYQIAHRRFGSWHNALEAAGIKSEPRIKWSKERVIKELRAAHRLSTPYRELDTRLLEAARKYFGGMREAKRAAGLDSKPPKWNREKVIEAIQDRHVRGLSIQSTDRDGFRPLDGAASRLFGNWFNAIEAAGLGHVVPRPRPKQQWTREKVIRAIQARHQRGLPLESVKHLDRSLYDATCTHFGCWGNALEAAGFPRKVFRTWDAQRVLEEIRTRHQRGLPLTSIEKYDCSVGSAARKFYGDWGSALEAAGLERSFTKWSKHLIITEIRKRQREGLSLSSGIASNINLVGAASRYFGTWRKAKEAAGVSQNGSREK